MPQFVISILIFDRYSRKTRDRLSRLSRGLEVFLRTNMCPVRCVAFSKSKSLNSLEIFLVRATLEKIRSRFFARCCLRVDSLFQIFIYE